MIGVMRQIALSQGFRHLIAPVRPSLKSRYPLIPIEEYSRWQNSDGLPFDPWLRVHVQVGGKILHPCTSAMVVKGSRQQWTEWLRLDFPGEGNYTIPSKEACAYAHSQFKDAGNFLKGGKDWAACLRLAERLDPSFKD